MGDAGIAGVRRVDVVSDTHGHLPPELLERLDGADVIVHAGDLCSPLDLDALNAIAPTYAALGNNDWSYEYENHFGRLYERAVRKTVRMELFGLRWEVCHYRERLDLAWCDVGICGHTHRPHVERTQAGVLVMNPGSPCRPRTTMGPTFGRILVSGGEVVDAVIEQLPVKPQMAWYF